MEKVPNWFIKKMTDKLSEWDYNSSDEDIVAVKQVLNELLNDAMTSSKEFSGSHLIFIVDYDVETGQENSDLNPSFAWICEKEFYNKRRCIDDRFRDTEIPDFKGWNDMEGHFEFDMNREEMISYLEGLGLTRLFS